MASSEGVVLNLSGTTAVVTGASRNIGAAVARGLAEAGADLILVARGHEALADVAAVIAAATGRTVTPVTADVGSRAGVAAVLTAASKLPSIGVLVNNAYDTGGTLDEDLLEVSDETWERVLAVNLRAPLNLSRGLMPALRANRGAIVNMLSGAAFATYPGLGPYGVAKAGLWSLTRYLAQAAAPDVRVNAVSPGQISETGVRNRLIPELVASAPLARLGGPQEVVGAVLYYVSALSSYVTGDVTFVDGGRTVAGARA